MEATVEAIIRESATRPKRWARSPNGRYSIYDVPIAEPHNYDGDIFDGDRQDAILKTTLKEEPEGGVWIGHPGFGDNEAPRVGRMVNYRSSSLGRHSADFVDLEPPAFLDIALDRFPSYSVEYRLPNIDAYTGIALLGRSQAFFKFARLRVALTDAQMDQLRRDADAWPKLSSTRSAKKTQPTNPKGNRAMKKQFRQTMTKDGLVWQLREQKDDGTFGDWRNLREGESVDNDQGEDMAKVRTAVEELGGRMSNIETRIDKIEESIGGGKDDDRAADEGDDDKGDDDKKKDDDKRKIKPGPGSTRRVADPDVVKRLDAIEKNTVRTRYDAKIDGLVAGGAVIDKSTRTAILAAVDAGADDAARDTVFEALTKSVRKVALSDTDGKEDDLKDADPLLADLEEKDAKAVRSLMGRFGPNAKKAARTALKEFVEMKKADPDAFGISAGAANWIEANVDPGLHDAA